MAHMMEKHLTRHSEISYNDEINVPQVKSGYTKKAPYLMD